MKTLKKSWQLQFPKEISISRERNVHLEALTFIAVPIKTSWQLEPATFNQMQFALALTREIPANKLPIALLADQNIQITSWRIIFKR